MPKLAPKRQLTSTVYATPLMTPTTDLGMSIRVSIFEYVRLLTGTSLEEVSVLGGRMMNSVSGAAVSFWCWFCACTQLC